jgi:hypothetical protein
MAEHAPSLAKRSSPIWSASGEADLARLLSAAGTEPITEDMIEEDIAEGAPTNADGRINLVHYTAWLVRTEGAGRAD